MAACPDNQWRAIIALSRYAGLRCPSELVALKWGDVNWERGRLTVRSPKTAGHEGHAVRIVPIAPELRAILQDLFDQADPGTEAVVPRLRDPRINLRTTFTKIVARAGVKPWPRLFHNMRASCACDWVERFPAHVVAGWLGHSPLIAAQHYLQTRDAHFDLATGLAESGAQSGALEAQNAAQHPTARVRTSSPDSSKSPSFVGVLRPDASECEAATKESNGRGRIRTFEGYAT
jgi:integrase